MLRSLGNTLLNATLVAMLALTLGLFSSASPALALTPAALPGLNGLFAGTPPTNIGVNDGHLSPCPTTPNCVVSENADEEHLVAPFTYTGDPAAAIDQLADLIAAQPRTTIIEQTATYLYAEFASRLMGFVDDVEFYADPDAQVVQVRAAARLGESDLGVNRKRVETLRQQFNPA